jgi:hypothetical protein
MNQILGKEKIDEKVNYEDIFSLKNKLSKFLPAFKLPISYKDKKYFRSIKLCIPYPKVEPPEISPQFNSSLL